MQFDLVVSFIALCMCKKGSECNVQLVYKYQMRFTLPAPSRVTQYKLEKKVNK